MVIAMATMLSSDAVVKTVATELPLFQIIFIRHVLMTAGLAYLVYRDGAYRCRPNKRDARLIGQRCLGEVLIICFYATALTLMPLGEATAIVQLQPLAVTLAAVVFLGQPIGARRLLAIAVGFGGVLLIVRPGSEAFSPAALLVLAAVASVCLRDISTRLLGPTIPATLLAALGSAALLLVSLGLMLAQGGWQPVTLAQLGLISLGAAALLAGYLAMVHAMRLGEMAVISPFRYVSLVIGIVIGAVFFGESPEIWTLLGGAIIVASGIYTFLREAQAKA